MGVILEVARSLEDAGIAQQHLSGRVPGRGSLPRARPGPDRPQMRRRRAGLFPGRDPRPHARGSVREPAAARPPAAGPPGGAAPHASRSCIRAGRQPRWRTRKCHGLAALPSVFCPPRRAVATRLSPTRWHGCRFPWSGGPAVVAERDRNAGSPSSLSPDRRRCWATPPADIRAQAVQLVLGSLALAVSSRCWPVCCPVRRRHSSPVAGCLPVVDCEFELQYGRRLPAWSLPSAACNWTRCHHRGS